MKRLVAALSTHFPFSTRPKYISAENVSDVNIIKEP